MNTSKFAKFLQPWFVAYCAILLAMTALFVTLKYNQMIALFKGSPNEDLAYGIPLALLSIPGLMIPGLAAVVYACIGAGLVYLATKGKKLTPDAPFTEAFVLGFVMACIVSFIPSIILSADFCAEPGIRDRDWCHSVLAREKHNERYCDLVSSESFDTCTSMAGYKYYNTVTMNS